VIFRHSLLRGINTLLRRSDTVDVTNEIGASGRRVGKVKAWGRAGKRYTNGDAVPHLKGRSTYSVQTTEGWFVNVSAGKIMSWSRRAIHTTVADTSGRIVTPGWRR